MPVPHISPGVSGKPLKHKVKFSHKFTDSSKQPYFIHLFCDEISIATAMNQPLLQKLWPV
jgi:hypothetical protein